MIESKYLSYVERNEDAIRLLKYFQGKFADLEKQYNAAHWSQGFFIAPTHRLFTYMMTRVLLSHYSKNCLSSDPAEESKSDDFATPPTNFHEYLMENNFCDSSDELQSLIE